MWHGDGTPATDSLASDHQTEGEYQAQLRWDWHTPYHGYRGRPVTAAEDFAAPYTPTIEELLEELI